MKSRTHDGKPCQEGGKNATTSLLIVDVDPDLGVLIQEVAEDHRRTYDMKQVLVIDDDAAARSMLQDLIEEMGHEVSVAENGDEGLRRFEERPFNLVICDILMPEKEGIETIREIKKKNPYTQVIAISGGGRSGNVEFLKMAQSLGADCAIRKPFEIEVMERTISDLLAERAK